MCLRGRTGAQLRAQDIRRQVGAPSVQFSPVILCNLTPVLTGPAAGAAGRSRLAHRGRAPPCPHASRATAGGYADRRTD